MSIDSLYLATISRGGATYDIQRGQMLELTGRVLPIRPDALVVVSLDSFTTDVILEYIQKHHEELEVNHHYLGTRLSPEEQVHLDIVTSYDNQDDAMTLAKELERTSQNRIRSIYHAQTGEELSLSGDEGDS